jgi:hypothetical protein
MLLSGATLPPSLRPFPSPPLPALCHLPLLQLSCPQQVRLPLCLPVSAPNTFEERWIAILHHLSPPRQFASREQCAQGRPKYFCLMCWTQSNINTGMCAPSDVSIIGSKKRMLRDLTSCHDIEKMGMRCSSLRFQQRIMCFVSYMVEIPGPCT